MLTRAAEERNEVWTAKVIGELRHDYDAHGLPGNSKGLDELARRTAEVIMQVAKARLEGGPGNKRRRDLVRRRKALVNRAMVAEMEMVSHLRQTLAAGGHQVVIALYEKGQARLSCILIHLVNRAVDERADIREMVRWGAFPCCISKDRLPTTVNYLTLPTAAMSESLIEDFVKHGGGVVQGERDKNTKLVFLLPPDMDEGHRTAMADDFIHALESGDGLGTEPFKDN
jgi:hypothetical protein